MNWLSSPETRLVEDLKIEAVINEMNAGIRDDVAWARALKKALGDEERATSLYIDERIRRLEDLWHIEQRSKLNKSDYELAEKLSKLEEDYKKLSKRLWKFNVFVFCCIIVLGTASVISLRLEQPNLGKYLVLVIISLLTFSAAFGSRLEAKRDYLKRQIEKSSPVRWSGSNLIPIFIFTLLGFAFLYFLGV